MIEMLRKLIQPEMDLHNPNAVKAAEMIRAQARKMGDERVANLSIEELLPILREVMAKHDVTFKEPTRQ